MHALSNIKHTAPGIKFPAGSGAVLRLGQRHRRKLANINPLPKIDIPVDCTDFRGINNSLLLVITRVFERTK